MYIFSPSLTYGVGSADLGFDIKLAGQFYEVDIDILNEDDQHLSGYNLRGTAQVRFLQMFRVFSTFAYRQNQQVAIPDVETLADDDFTGFVIAGGAEWSWEDLVVGGQYYRIETELGPATGDLAANVSVRLAAAIPPGTGGGTRAGRARSGGRHGLRAFGSGEGPG